MPAGKMTLAERATLSPFEKYMRFGRFPWKMVFHFLLVGLLTVQAEAALNLLQKHNRALEQQYTALFLGLDPGQSVAQLYDLIDFQTGIGQVFIAVKQLPQQLFQKVDTKNLEASISVLHLTIQDEPASWAINLESGTIKEPFDLEDPTSVQKFLTSTRRFTIRLSNLITVIQASTRHLWRARRLSCLNWTIDLDYDVRSVVTATLGTTVQACEEENSDYLVTHDGGLHLAVLAVALANLLLQFHNGYEHMTSIAQDEQRSKILSRKGFGYRRLDPWTALGASCNVLQMVGAVVALRDEQVISDNSFYKEMVIGLGCLGGYIGLLQYLDKVTGRGLLVGTLQKMGRQFLYFLAGVIPLFMFFAVLGQSLFWRYEFFETLSATALSLFGMFNGDVMNDTAEQLQGARYAGMLYEVLFVVVFYSTVQTVLITIIIEGHDMVLGEEESRNAQEMAEEQQRFQYQRKVTSQSISGTLNSQAEGPERATRMLNSMQTIISDIDTSALPDGEKRYLLSLFQENLQNTCRSVDFQILRVR